MLVNRGNVSVVAAAQELLLIFAATLSDALAAGPFGYESSALPLRPPRHTNMAFYIIGLGVR